MSGHERRGQERRVRVAERRGKLGTGEERREKESSGEEKRGEETPLTIVITCLLGS